MIDNSERSGIHRQAEAWLRKCGLDFESERSFPPYRVDIYLPEWHIAVEIDGPWHSRSSDAKRDAYLLETYGLPILRYGYKDMYVNRFTDAVVAFIERHSEDVQERKHD